MNNFEETDLNSFEKAGLTLEQVKFYIEKYYPKKHGHTFPRKVVFLNGLLQDNCEQFCKDFIKNTGNDFIKYAICSRINETDNKPHHEFIIYGQLKGKKFAIVNTKKNGYVLSNFFYEKELNVDTICTQLQNDYINCGIFAIENIKHLGEKEIEKLLTCIHDKNCRFDSIELNPRKKYYILGDSRFLPVSLAAYSQSLEKLENTLNSEQYLNPEKKEKLNSKIKKARGKDNYDIEKDMNVRANNKKKKILSEYSKYNVGNNTGKSSKKNCEIF